MKKKIWDTVADVAAYVLVSAVIVVTVSGAARLVVWMWS